MENSVTEKSEAVRRMFSSIAHRYDFLNHLLSMGVDIVWRKQAVAQLGSLDGRSFLDVACGTGDLSIEIAMAGAGKVTGGDFSDNMITIGREKVKKNGLDGKITVEFADALNLPYSDAQFDGATCAFGARNFADLDRGLNEMARVVKPGGRLVILEFTTPSNPLFAEVYRLYFTRILPLVGGIFSGMKSAYEYLPDSVYKFPAPAEFSSRIEKAGFTDVRFTPLTLGICGIHSGVRV